MKEQRVLRRGANRSYILIVLLTVMLVFCAAVTFLRGSAKKAVAESGGTVTIHVYDPTEGYANLGAWVWLRGGSGTPYTDISIADGEQFKKEDLNNTAYSITATFNANEIEKLKTTTNLGFLICTKKEGEGSATVWDNYKKEGADVFVDITKAFDNNNHADVYYLRKDSIAYTNVEDAKMALEKVTSAKFTAKTASSVTVEFEATSPITSATDVELYKDGEKVATAKPTPSADNRFKATAVFTGVAFDFSSVYQLKVTTIPTGAAVSLNAFIDDPSFISAFENVKAQNAVYGATYAKEKTVFRVWAPFATRVSVNLYRDGFTGSAYSSVTMKKAVDEGSEWCGVWEQEVLGDYKGVYYTYTVGNPGAEVETIDPYAKAAGANGLRGMIVDLSTTDPVGWENDKHLYATNPANADVPIIWELHVQDFSASPDSGMKYKGKYLAFTEKGTTVPGKPNLKTGVDYLKELGVTYVQLNPVYDFATVDESDMSVADDTKDTFNWGYDPQNYNVPEGSYSTDPNDGNVRIREFKQMVMALHNAGIGVIMDVVYNHTYSTNGQALNDTVPNYYHRTDENGSFTDGSGCGNETATERTMTRKYIIDSLKYWATEYHIDGFRFDLMGIHDVETLRQIRQMLDGLDGGNGTKILTYGEPWSGDGKDYTPNSFTKRTGMTANASGLTANPVGNRLIKQCRRDDAGWGYWFDIAGTNGGVRLPDRVAIFGDTGRDGLRGNNDPGQGWANGDNGKMPQVQKMMEGYCGGSGEGIVTANGSQCVAYASAHDNYTLWDQMCGKKAAAETPAFYDNPDAGRIKQCKLIASSLMTSSGIVFMLAGDEMGRTKYGNHNSYNSVAKLNQLVWSRQEDFKTLHDYYADAIKMRKDNRETFSYSGTTTVSNCTGNFTGTTGSKIVYATHDGKVTCELDGYSKTGNIKVNGQTKLSF